MASAKEWEQRKARWARWRKRMREDEAYARDAIMQMHELLATNEVDYEAMISLVLDTAERITEDC